MSETTEHPSPRSANVQQRLAIVLVAAGRGERVGGDVPKQFMEFGGEPLFLHSLRTLQRTRLAVRTVVVVPTQWESRVAQWVRQAGLQADAIVTGGATRQASVQHGLASLRQQGSPLLVAGRSERRGLRSLGSTATYLSANAPCDVLLVDVSDL